MWPQPGCWAPLTHFDGAQLEVLARVIVDNGHEVIAQVALLVTAMLVPILRGHQGGDVKDGCEAEWGPWSGHGMTPARCWQGLLGWTGAAKVRGQQALCLSPGASPGSPRGSERLQGPHLVPSQQHLASLPKGRASGSTAISPFAALVPGLVVTLGTSTAPKGGPTGMGLGGHVPQEGTHLA